MSKIDDNDVAERIEAHATNLNQVASKQKAVLIQLGQDSPVSWWFLHEHYQLAIDALDNLISKSAELATTFRQARGEE